MNPVRHPIQWVKQALDRMIHPRGGMLILGMPGTSVDYQRLVGGGEHSSILQAPIRWTQRALPEAPLRLRMIERDGSKTPVTDHRMLALLRRPNPYYDGIKLLQATIASRETDGNAYWLKVRNASGAVVELWWTPHNLMSPARRDGASEFITHYEYTPSGFPISIEPRDVVHFRVGLDASNPMLGCAPLKSLLRELYTDLEAANWTATLLRNMGVPGVVISPAVNDEGMWTGAEDAKQTKRAFKQATTGDSRGEPLVLTAPTKIQQFGFSPSDMNLKDLRRIPEERVTAVLGVPAIVCGLGAGLDRSTFSNMQEARDSAYESKIIPDQREISAEIQHQLLPDFEQRPDMMLLDFDVTDLRVFQDDQGRIADTWGRLVGTGAVTVAELREQFGLPVDDTHRIYLRGLNTRGARGLDNEQRHPGAECYRTRWPT
jgi:HK97 family phage portal protein